MNQHSSPSQQQRVDWSAGRWTHEPAATRVAPDGVLHATAVEGSDAWRHTAYGFVHDTEHALVTPFMPGSAMEVEFGTPFSQQFDQAGIFVRASDEHWVKAGIEFADGVPRSVLSSPMAVRTGRPRLLPPGAAGLA